SRNGASGSRLLLSSMSAPAPLAHQWFGLTPLPMNSAAKRLGKAGGAPPPAAGSSPQTGRDSSQGRARATPAPRSRVRRSMRGLAGLMDPSPGVAGQSILPDRESKWKGFAALTRSPRRTDSFAP